MQGRSREGQEGGGVQQVCAGHEKRANRKACVRLPSLASASVCPPGLGLGLPTIRPGLGKTPARHGMVQPQEAGRHACPPVSLSLSVTSSISIIIIHVARHQNTIQCLLSRSVSTGKGPGAAAEGWGRYVGYKGEGQVVGWQAAGERGTGKEG